MTHSNLSDRMYKEYIMELYKNPSNYGNLKNHTHEHTEQNTFCGDEITIQLIAKKGKIEDAKFSGSGCVISMVSASLLTDKAKKMKISDIKRLGTKDMLKLIKTKINPARIKCVLLPLDAVKGALGKNA